MNAVIIADFFSVSRILSKDPLIFNADFPVLINKAESNHGRTPIMMCGLDPQQNSVSLIDENCLKIVQMLTNFKANITQIDKYGWDQGCY
jgi:hypothetical protein